MATKSKPKARPQAATKIHCLHDDIVDARELKPFDGNPNVHTSAQIALLREVILANGWRNPIVVSKRSGRITKGHGRLAAALQMGEAGGKYGVPVEYQAYASEQAELQDVIADNRLAELSMLDKAQVFDLLKEVDGFSFGESELAAFGFGANEFLGFQSADDVNSTIVPKGAENTEWEDVAEFTPKNRPFTLIVTFQTEEARDEFVKSKKITITAKQRNNWSAAYPPSPRKDRTAEQYE